CHDHLVNIILICLSVRRLNLEACRLSILSPGVNYKTVLLSSFESFHCLADLSGLCAAHCKYRYTVAVIIKLNVCISVLLPYREITAVETCILERASLAPYSLILFRLARIYYIRSCRLSRNRHLSVCYLKRVNKIFP